MNTSSSRSLLLCAGAGLALSLLSALPAAAHGAAGTGAGALHPLLGVDHVLLLLGVGLAAGRFGNQLLLAALVGGVTGSLLGHFGAVLPGAELLAALTVSLLGLSLLQGGRLLPLVVAGGMAIHGLLHGLEASGGAAWWLGAFASSAVVASAGLLISRRLQQRPQQLAAAALALLGGLLALAPL